MLLRIVLTEAMMAACSWAASHWEKLSAFYTPSKLVRQQAASTGEVAVVPG